MILVSTLAALGYDLVYTQTAHYLVKTPGLKIHFIFLLIPTMTFNLDLVSS